MNPDNRNEPHPKAFQKGEGDKEGEGWRETWLKHLYIQPFLQTGD